MKMDLRSLLAAGLSLLLLLLLLTAAAPPVRSQAAEEEPEEEEAGLGFVMGEFTFWVAQPVGLEFEPATERDPANPFATRILRDTPSTESEHRIRVGYQLAKNWGALVLTVYEHTSDLALSAQRPGLAVFGESLVNPLFAGLDYDGLADAFDSEARAELSDVRVDFYRDAFRTRRVEGKWYVGVRRVKHDRSQRASYFTVLDDLPVFLPPLSSSPQTQLDPLPDSAAIRSEFEGRGVTAGMDFRMPLFRDRVYVESGFAVGALRGELDASYNSTTHYYVETLGTGELVILYPPYDEFDDVFTNPQTGETQPRANFISQRDVDMGLNVDRRSQTSEIIDAYLGLRWRAWKDLQVVLGFRNTRYTDVGVDLRPTLAVAPGGVRLNQEDGSLQGVNLESVTEVDRSVTYEGFYAGIAWRF